jgi:hypothetical protein
MKKARVPSGPILSTAGIMAEPQYQQRGMFQTAAPPGSTQQVRRFGGRLCLGGRWLCLLGLLWCCVLRVVQPCSATVCNGMAAGDGGAPAMLGRTALGMPTEDDGTHVLIHVDSNLLIACSSLTLIDHMPCCTGDHASAAASNERHTWQHALGRARAGAAHRADPAGRAGHGAGGDRASAGVRGDLGRQWRGRQ